VCLFVAQVTFSTEDRKKKSLAVGKKKPSEGHGTLQQSLPDPRIATTLFVGGEGQKKEGP